MGGDQIKHPLGQLQTADGPQYTQLPRLEPMMFSLFGKKKASTQDVVELALVAGCWCRAWEKENGDVHADFVLIEAYVSEGAKDFPKPLLFGPTELQAAKALVMKLLLERTFVSELAERAEQGPLNGLTATDQKRVKAILPEAFA